MKKITDIKTMQIILFCMPFCFGLFYLFSAYFFGAVLCLFLLYTVIKNKNISFSLNAISICVFIFVLSFLIVCFYAIDKGMAFLGFIKFLPILLFYILLMQFEKKERLELFSAIPLSGAVMVCISAITYFIPFLKDSFFRADRLGGFFQYSNTFALFLLIGIIVVLNKEKKTKYEYVQFVILTIGILLSGSRSVWIFMLSIFVMFIVKKKKLRKPLLITIGTILMFSVVFVIITGSYQTFGRYLTIFTQNSTFWGRLLYYQDGLKLLCEKPFGLGYMGYYFIQPLIQTGIYTTQFIHNDILQIALDVGIIPLILFLIVIIKSLFSKRTSALQKQILAVIVLHSLFDFNLQFMIMAFILIMTLEIGDVKYCSKICVPNILVSIISGIFIYFAISNFSNFLGNNQLSKNMYPYNTFVNLEMIAQENDMKKIGAIADDIIRQNKVAVSAYQVKAEQALINKDFETMIAYKKKTIDILKYDITNYEDYIFKLSKAIDYFVRGGDMTKAMEYKDLVLQVEQTLEKLKANTSDLAFKIRDKPKFELSQPLKKYIISLKGVGKNEK